MTHALAPADIDFNKTFYYSGPMFGYPEHNYPKFTADTAVLRAIGLKIESPHENAWPENHADMDPNELWKAMMTKAMAQLKKCNAIILMKGWPQSRGARIELNYALDECWRVYYYDNYILTSMNREGMN